MNITYSFKTLALFKGVTPSSYRNHPYKILSCNQGEIK